MTFENACSLAQIELIKNNYRKGFKSVLENEEGWFFCGKRTKSDKPEYGSKPLFVQKGSGKHEMVDISSALGLAFVKAKEISFPSEYKLT